MPSATATDPLRFGRIVISPAERAVSVDGRPVAVGARAFDVLLALAERRARLVSRQELLDLAWPGVVVEEHNITTQISALRKLLGAQVIATVPGRGYRFVAAAEQAGEERSNGGQVAQPRHNLPEQRTRFIGRRTALADLERLLGQARLLTLTGIGGSGKTRLALECARLHLGDFADGVWFVDLAPLDANERVAFAFAAALGLGDDVEDSLVDRLAADLARRQSLIVVDNCEHVRGAVATLVDALLARAGRTRILATSREPLGVSGEQLYPLPPLSLPATDAPGDIADADAVRMFVDRVRLNLPEFEPDAGNAVAIAGLCRQLDGIALAIELAAARVPLLSVPDIAARLDDRFRLLTRGNAAVARQQTLAATMQWSYDLLEPAEQRMLRLLAVFAGGCTLESAVAVAQSTDEYEALALLTALHDKSLLVVERGTGDEGRPRYRLLETVRQYARERLDACGETESAVARHAGHFLARAETAAPHLNGPQESLWLERLHAERENLAAAMSWCAEEASAADPSWALRLSAATNKYWLFNEIELGSRLALGALQRDRSDTDSAARFHTLRGLSALYMHRGQGAAGLPYARAALALAERAANEEWQALGHNAIGTCLDRSGDEAGGWRHLEQSRDLAQSIGCKAILSSALNNIALRRFRHGELDSAETGLREAMHLARDLGNLRSELLIANNLIRVLVAAHKQVDALACAVESERLLRGVREDALKLELLEVTAGLASTRGEHEVAARLWGFACQRLLDEGYRRPVEDDAQIADLSAHSREAIGAAAFDRAEAVGRAWDLETALRELRSWLNVRT